MFLTKVVLSPNATSADEYSEHIKHNEVLKRERLRAQRIKAFSAPTKKTKRK
jgi:hypothetical protein